MALVIKRDGTGLGAPELTEPERETLWAALLRAYLGEHPEAAADLSGQDAAGVSTAPA